jgi:AraC family transcriptional regulator of arabinose operon
VHTGSAYVSVDGVTREIGAGQVGLLLPGAVEFFAFARTRETRHSWITLPPSYLDDDERRALGQVRDCLSLSPAMQACVEVGCEVAEVDDPARRPVLVAVARAALALYVAEATYAAVAQRAAHPAVTRACEVARRRAREGIGVQDLAREVGLSTEHLVRLFRRDTGLTPGAFLRAERLAHGMHLLEHTGLPVAEVAQQSGFASPHHFARCLRAAVGLTPTQLRTRHWAASTAGLRRPNGPLSLHSSP